MIRGHLHSVFALALCGAICAACQRPAETPPIKPEYDRNTGKLTRLSHDTNGNGKLDTVALMDGERVVRIEADEDENGTVDRWEYYTANPEQTSNDGGRQADVLERVERATNRDGRVNRWEFFEAGALARVNEDTTGDGRVDKWEEYSGGTLTVLALDTVGRGTPDRKLLYDPDGNLDHIEVDPDGSGRFQRAKP